jgi:hypothetical protein
VIILTPDWYTVVAFIAITHGHPVPSHEEATFILWERTCYQFGTVDQVKAQVVEHYQA